VLRYFTRSDVPELIDKQRNVVLSEMQKLGVAHEDYPKLMAYLERLSEIKDKERNDPLSKDTVALIFGNLMGILLIVAYEQKHVMTSKGFSQIIRPR
jgi:hypothetical protein